MLPLIKLVGLFTWSKTIVALAVSAPAITIATANAAMLDCIVIDYYRKTNFDLCRLGTCCCAFGTWGGGAGIGKDRTGRERGGGDRFRPERSCVQPFRASWQVAIRSRPRFLRPRLSWRRVSFPQYNVARHFRCAKAGGQFSRLAHRQPSNFHTIATKFGSSISKTPSMAGFSP